MRCVVVLNFARAACGGPPQAREEEEEEESLFKTQADVVNEDSDDSERGDQEL